jgi:hypothetical protein
MMVTVSLKTIIGLSIFGLLVVLLIGIKSAEAIEKWWKRRKQKP